MENTNQVLQSTPTGSCDEPLSQVLILSGKHADEFLERHLHKHLICLSGCFASNPPPTVISITHNSTPKTGKLPTDDEIVALVNALIATGVSASTIAKRAKVDNSTLSLTRTSTKRRNQSHKYQRLYDACTGIITDIAKLLPTNTMRSTPIGMQSTPTGVRSTKKDYSFQNLEGANFQNADLQGADFMCAILERANFQGANLVRAKLQEANLRGADLRGADLRGADLRDAEFQDANLDGALIDYQIEEGLLLKVAHAALQDGALDMDICNSSDTTHCIAGWAEQLSEKTRALEETHGREVAGLLTLGAEAHKYFWASNEEVREFLQSVIDNADAMRCVAPRQMRSTP
jgi:uncharacterized protein YjbI with pentapeptide repeats